MSDEERVTDRTMPTSAGAGEDEEDLPRSDDEAPGDHSERAQQAAEELDNPIGGEGATPEGRRQARDTAAGPQEQGAGAGPTERRGPDTEEPDPGAVGPDERPDRPG